MDFLMVNGNPTNPDILPYCPFTVHRDDKEAVLDYHNGQTVKVALEEFEDLNQEGLLQEIRITKQFHNEKPCEAFEELQKIAPFVKKNTIWRQRHSPIEWGCLEPMASTRKDRSWCIRVVLTTIVGKQKVRRLWLDELLTQYEMVYSPERSVS